MKPSTSRPALMKPARTGLRSQRSEASTPSHRPGTTGDEPRVMAPTSVGIPDWVRYEYLLRRTGTTRSRATLATRTITAIG